MLKLSKLTKSFGAIAVADQISFSVSKGDAVGILGPNGAGKTSLFNLITGTLQADSGSIEFSDRDISSYSAAKRCKLGMARSFQVPQPFAKLTVFENALVAALHGAGLTKKQANNHALTVLEDTGLVDKANSTAGSLTLLERKRLEMARALAAKPSLLLLDEIAGGLTEAECSSLIDTIKTVQGKGTTIIWIEHVVHALLAVAERLVVMDFGKVIAEGEPKVILQSDAVKEIYLGIE